MEYGDDIVISTGNAHKLEEIGAILKDLNYNIHLYGKKDVRINRKMGHITFIDCDKTKVREFINKYIILFNYNNK